MQLNIKIKQPNQKMGGRFKQTFLQRRYTDGQEAHEKMLNITKYQRNANQNYNGEKKKKKLQWCIYHLTPVRIVNIKKEVSWRPHVT